MTDDAPLEIVRASPVRWSDLEEVLGVSGEVGCWCQAWRGFDAKAISGGRSRPELLRDQMHGEPPAPGYLAYLGAVPVGWVGVSVRTETPRLMASRTIPAIDDLPVWAIGCFQVRPGYRRRGIAKALLNGLVGAARAAGAPGVEAYPIDPEGRRVEVGAGFVGIAAMFDAAGFRRVLVTDAHSGRLPRLLVRLDLAASRLAEGMSSGPTSTGASESRPLGDRGSSMVADHGKSTEGSDMAENRGLTSAPIILVPGFWLGAWAWDEVAGTLRADGHDVTALTLPGLDSPSTDRSAITLSDHVDAIVEALRAADAPAVLAVHSATGFSGYAASDKVPERIAAMVYVDTAPGKGALDPDFADAEKPMIWKEVAEEENLDGLSEEQLETFRRRAVPVPGSLIREAAELTNDARRDIPSTIICTGFTAAQYQTYAKEHPDWAFLAGIPELRNVTWVDLPTSHWPMWSRPAELAGIIGDVAKAHGR